ncbi:MAG TPA: AraC family transcriptional regulator [Treponemataceae bacterium]|nr:AraC family transcriptional regulator [Treponemataceae bacterium]HPS43529.1 AraC family transcriptional regulator [Treponemataceae bacterium]
MDWNRRLAQAFDYLEDNLEGEADLDRAAAIANCSAFHLCRTFEILYGISPLEYLKRRKLSLASLDLAARNATVGEVAQRYGWDDPESFSRAFKRHFGLNPSDTRLKGARLETCPPIRFDVSLKRDKCPKCKIVEKPEFALTGLAMRTTIEENQRDASLAVFWQRVFTAGSCDLLWDNAGPMGLLGLCYDYVIADSSFSYMAAIETPVAGRSSLPPGCVSVTVPAATYAVFEGVGPMPETILALWKSIYAEWFPNSDYEHAGTPDFERYPAKAYHDVPPSNPEHRGEIWVPIKKKGLF